MKFEYYNISDNEGKSNCIIRTFCKLFDKDYDEVKIELLEITKQLNYDSYTEIEVFEKYLSNNNYSIIENNNDIKIKDLNLNDGRYAIFCYDKKDFYHMLCVIDNVVYDKNDDCLDLYVIKVYKLNK